MDVRVPLAQRQFVAVVVLQRLQDPRLCRNYMVRFKVIQQHLSPWSLTCLLG